MHLTMPEKKTAPSRMLLYLACGVLVLAGLGLYLWYEAGQLHFEADMQSASRPVLAPRQGVIAFVDVEAGRMVRRGDVLARFDDAALRAQVDKDRHTLSTLALALPPEHLSLPAQGGGTESLSEREDRRRQDEGEAERIVLDAANREAEAAIVYNRATLLAAQGKITPEQRAAAEAALNAAQREAAQARSRFESLSLSRAESSADIRRLKQAQLDSGAAALPVQTRLAAFDRAKENLARSEAALAATYITASEDGQVEAVYVRPGSQVESGGLVAALKPVKGGVLLEGRISSAQAGSVKNGLPCRIVFLGESDVYKGVVEDIDAPLAAHLGADAPYTVRVRLLPEQSELAGGADLAAASWAAKEKAQVTVLLRQKPVQAGTAKASPKENISGSVSGPSALPSDAFQPGSVQPDGATPSASAAPPASPLSVETPFGGPEVPSQNNTATPPAQRGGVPVTVKSGDTGASFAAPQGGGSAPLLPPMKAPSKLRGSPLPQADNNPSIARPSDLDSMDARP